MIEERHLRELIDALVKKLFEAERRRLASIITALNSRNKTLKGMTTDGFLFGGTYFLPSNVSKVVVGAGQAKPSLHFSLVPEMNAWVHDAKFVNDDQDLIRQMLFRLLKSCRNLGEVRNALPECLVGLSDVLKQYPRADEEGFTLRGDERAERQFKKLLPKMEIYSAARLMY